MVIRNLQRRDLDLYHSIVEWELVYVPLSSLNGSTLVLASSSFLRDIHQTDNHLNEPGTNSRSSVQLSWMTSKLDQYQMEKVEIQLHPKSSWSNFVSAKLHIRARNYFLLEPWLAAEADVVFYHKPSGLRFQIGERMKSIAGHDDQVWLDADEKIDLGCEIQNRGMPTSTLSGCVSAGRGLRVVASGDRLQWLGTLGMKGGEDHIQNCDGRGYEEEPRLRSSLSATLVQEWILFRCVVESRHRGMNFSRSY